ncbi:gamma-glutamyltransferase [Lichenicola cladoniae]|uniref:gamma-glutamyltransferase n=1 Tax=Lichenicola cladoniae TaxID=1484109 RepID=UPI001EF691AB|nr:gamma-glutamyltransferase [Lichenicola cladoniae]
MPNPVAASGNRPARPIPPTGCSGQPAAHRPQASRVLLGLALGLSASLPLAGCGSVSSVRNLVVGPPSPYLSGFIGNVVADEPVAALAGRDVLARGGNAADAAVAVGMALSVTLPSRASLGSGGACLAYRAGSGRSPEAFLFTPVAGTAPAGQDSRPASVPMTARGLFLMQARYGSVSFDELVKPAARLARSGITVSRALADDVAAVKGPLMGDPNARTIFAPGGKPIAAGDQLSQQDLANSLDRIALAGVGDLYTGVLWQQFTDGAAIAGGGLSRADLRNSVPAQSAALTVDAGPDRVAFLPPPADGGLGAAAAFRAGQSGDESGSLANGVVAAWRASHPGAVNGGDYAAEAQALVDRPSAGGSLGRLPASTSFTVVDRNGGAVACALTMDNLFGTGRIAGDTGIVLAASPARFPKPLLASSIAWNPTSGSFRAAVAGSGQNDAAIAVAAATSRALHGSPPSPVTETGRVNAIVCARGLPGDQSACTATTDPRGSGLATRSD